MTGKIKRIVETQEERAKRLQHVPEIRPLVLRAYNETRSDNEILLAAGYTEEQLRIWNLIKSKI